jgi:hypothetical protein
MAGINFRDYFDFILSERNPKHFIYISNAIKNIWASEVLLVQNLIARTATEQDLFIASSNLLCMSVVCYLPG